MSKNKHKKNKKNKGANMTESRIYSWSKTGLLQTEAINIVDTVADDGWDNNDEDLKVISACGRKPEGPLKIIFSRVVHNKINVLMKKYPACEWLAYLIGDVDTRYAQDLFLPLQEVSSGAVHVIGTKPAGCIGVIHSHHSMGAFFSGTDDTYINQNNDISVVVAHNGIKAQVRWVTPCGYKVVSEGKVVVESENLFNEAEFKSQVDSVVSQKIYSVVNSFAPLAPVDNITAKVAGNGFNTAKYKRGVPGLSGTSSLSDLAETSSDSEEERNELKDLLVGRFRNNC